ncbi:MAG: hypothetical protein GF393_02160 [Armatimonadia bacterium]|nr:hypothetical protein [Armatimonadia bacterium]
MPSAHDIDVLRPLAERTAEIAALPVQEDRREMWRALNGLDPVRPMVMIDQVCWNEFECDEDLQLRCEEPQCQGYERMLRRMLYQWDHFRVDMVVEPFIRVPKAIHNTGWGVSADDDIAVTDPTNSVVGHRYNNQFETEEDLDKLQTPQISHDAGETQRRLDVADELFGGILEIKPWGMGPPLQFWDPISTWMSVEGALWAMADRPEYVHRLMRKMTDGFMGMLDQLEEQGLLCEPQSLIHCTGAWTDDLPAPGYDPESPRCRDIWTMGLAQMFSTVSPAMFEEFEVDYIAPIAERFGLVYYGCCDPLSRKMDQVRMIPNVRKVSMSAWTDQELGAEEIGGEYVFSRKPTPASLATDEFDAEAVRQDLKTTRKICERHGCPLELILKDISTVRYDPERLTRWAEVAMEVAEG